MLLAIPVAEPHALTRSPTSDYRFYASGPFHEDLIHEYEEKFHFAFADWKMPWLFFLGACNILYLQGKEYIKGQAKLEGSSQMVSIDL